MRLNCRTGALNPLILRVTLFFCPLTVPNTLSEGEWKTRLSLDSEQMLIFSRSEGTNI